MKCIIGYTVLILSVLTACQTWAGKGGMAGNGTSDGGRSIFEEIPTEIQCRSCHDDLSSFPMLEDTNSNKHHLLIGKNITELTSPTGTIVENYYTCTACHPIVNAALYFTIDCLQCHLEERVIGTPADQDRNRHHLTETFLNRDCSVCHDNGR
jgi:hypothetical protein